jgi:uncharacterized protein (DUF736 family)
LALTLPYGRAVFNRNFPRPSASSRPLRCKIPRPLRGVDGRQPALPFRFAVEAAEGGFQNQKGDYTMATIGKFTLGTDGVYTGSISTLQLKAYDVRIIPNPDKGSSDNAPDYRVLAGAADIGAGWIKQAAGSGNQYLSLNLDDPSLTKSFFASLFLQDDGSHNLVFSRGRN